MNNYKGFFKVNENNGGVNVCTFFNPETKEEFSKIVWDIDNDRLLEDDEIQILRYLTIDNDAVIAWKHFNNAFVVGDNVEVIKGRKIPKGTILKVFWIGERDTHIKREHLKVRVADGRMKQRQSPDATMKMAKRSGSKQTIVNM